jgi:hypothetical protein
MSARTCVVINDYGGVPYALRANLTAGQQNWVCTCDADVALPYTDPRQCLPHVLPQRLFSELQRRGVLVALLGGTAQMRAAHHARRDEGLQHVGVARCSLFDDDAFHGPSDPYDDDVVHQTLGLLGELGSDAPCMLWINLLAARDGAEDAIAVPHNVPFDHRIVPKNLHVVIAASGPAAQQRAAEQAYAHRLASCRRIMTAHAQRVRHIVSRVLARDAHAQIAYTSTRSLSLGEHGIVGGDSPTHTGCTTFVLTNVASFACAPTLRACLSDFVAQAWSLPVPPLSDERRTIVGDHSSVRRIVTVRAHTYALVFASAADDAPRHVFDLTMDPWETEDIALHVQHLGLLRPEPVALPELRPEPVALPEPEAPPVSPPPPPPLPEEHEPESLVTLRPPSIVTPSSPASSPQRRVSTVRANERRLNKMHR